MNFINYNKESVITKQFKLTAFYAFGILEILKVVDPQKVSCST